MTFESLLAHDPELEMEWDVRVDSGWFDPGSSWIVHLPVRLGAGRRPALSLLVTRRTNRRFIVAALGVPTVGMGWPWRWGARKRSLKGWGHGGDLYSRSDALRRKILWAVIDTCAPSLRDVALRYFRFKL